jgi:hypothetical protein
MDMKGPAADHFEPGNAMLMELRSDLCATARSITDRGTAAAANKLEDRRRVLRTKIRALSDNLKKWASASQERVSNGFGRESFGLEEDLLAEFRKEQPDIDPLEDSDDEDGYEDDEEDLLSVVDSGDLLYNTPEEVSVWCPSRDPTFQNENVKYQELSLREAQAAACIESIRQCIGQKSVLIKALVRRHRGAGQKKTSRAWGEVNKAHVDMVKHWAAYRRATRAMKTLPEAEASAKKFKPIEKSDLKSVADITAPNRVGQRNDSLPWFWSAHEAQDNPKWVAESKQMLALRTIG